ncbi:MAG: hypothetical protein D6722_03595, partial [Bacteroidetes bacterium]
SYLPILLLSLLSACRPVPSDPPPAPAYETGYRGIWDGNQARDDEYAYKYAGGLGTYPQQHIPIAVYSEEARKTFFVYGGSEADRNSLVYAIGYFDHTTGMVSRPVRIAAKETQDPHDNPVLSIDAKGYLWVFANAHGLARPAFVYRSRAPYDIRFFDQVDSTNFSYSQPWHLGEKGFLWLRTQYQQEYGMRHLYWLTSRDGFQWRDPQRLVAIEQGNYQISWSDGDKVATAFDMHPEPYGPYLEEEGYMGLNWRSNIYYLETRDGGQSWQTIQGDTIQPPVTDRGHISLAYNSLQDDQRVYLKDLAFDEAGRPVILFLLANSYKPGPESGPRSWHTLAWDGQAWQRSAPIFISDHNYDHGSLYLEADGTWRIIAPGLPGPQPHATGGEMGMWVSHDRGQNWDLKPLTTGSRFNHTYARRPLHAHPDFYALWADGHGTEPSSSRLYFTDRAGSAVWQLPAEMDSTHARPVRVRK